MSDSITFKYTLTEGDAVRALRYQGTSSKLFWVMAGLLALVLGYGLLSSLSSVMTGQKGWDSLLRSLLIYGGLGAAWASFVWFHPVWTAKRWPSIGVEREITVSGDGMTTRSELGYSESTWASYTGVLETDDFFLLFMGRANFQPIPKRDLAAVSAVSDLREFLRAQFPDYRRA